MPKLSPESRAIARDIAMSWVDVVADGGVLRFGFQQTIKNGSSFQQPFAKFEFHFCGCELLVK